MPKITLNSISNSFTHFHLHEDVRGFRENVRRNIHVFNLDECEKCGCECEAPNAIGVYATPRELEDQGMIYMSDLPSEQGYCEKFGGAVCYDCGEWDY